MILAIARLVTLRSLRVIRKVAVRSARCVAAQDGRVCVAAQDGRVCVAAQDGRVCVAESCNLVKECRYFRDPDNGGVKYL
jgi:hypothetical protein